MITRFHIQNYKALRDLSLDLTPIHVLIGQNDTGKTSILEAIAALCRSVDHSLDQAFVGRWAGRELVWNQDRDADVSLAAAIQHADQDIEYQLVCGFKKAERVAFCKAEQVTFGDTGQTVSLSHRDTLTGVCIIATHERPAPSEQRGAAQLVFDALSGVHYYRFVPNLLALPVVADLKRRFRMEHSGFGLAACLEDILAYDRARFSQLEERFRKAFPQIRRIKLVPEAAFNAPHDDPLNVPRFGTGAGRGIYLESESSGADIPASQASDGTLLVLACTAILYLPEPPRVLLLEEPENGIHPSRLKDVISILRDLVLESKQTQVILTTHSPYLLDLFEPDEISLCAKGADGAVTAHRLSDSETVRRQIDVFTLGEIWTGEGDDAIAAAAKSGKDAEP